MIERITYDVGDDRIVGNLHLPPDGAPHLAVVVAGPMTSVKEQAAGNYASALAKLGIAALAIDHRGYGQSQGTPRQYEHHGRKVEDLIAAIDYLSVHPKIASGRIGIVGVCLGSGYAVTAAAKDSRIKAIGAVAGYYRDPADIRAADPTAFDKKVEEGRSARTLFELTGEVVNIPAVALHGDAAMQSEDTFDYYTRRAAVSNYTNAFALMSREFFVPFDVQSTASQIRVPIAMVHSERGISPKWAKKFYQSVGSPKTIDWIKSNGQTDIYDDESIIASAADKIARHFFTYV